MPSPHGFPVLRSISVYRHAVVNTPVARWALIARGTAYSNCFPVPSGCGLPHIHARSATTLDFSRPAQCSLAITACRLAESPKRPVCLEGSDGFVSSPRRFDSYRLERPSCRVGISPTEDQHLLHGAQVWCPWNSAAETVYWHGGRRVPGSAHANNAGVNRPRSPSHSVPHGARIPSGLQRFQSALQTLAAGHCPAC